MATAIPLTDEQVEELVGDAKADGAIWLEFKKREAEGDRLRLGTSSEQPKLPSRVTIADELMKRRYGDDRHKFQHAGLILRMRFYARTELGLSLD